MKLFIQRHVNTHKPFDMQINEGLYCRSWYALDASCPIYMPLAPDVSLVIEENNRKSLLEK